METCYVITTNELYHHGILGMKWGVRRYQNYDGTYTKKGLEHYRESEKNYNAAKNEYKSAKAQYKIAKKSGNYEQANKYTVKKAKENLRGAKKQLSRDYDQLKKDKKADKGKELYRSGKTITGNYTRLQAAGYIASGTAMASSYLAKMGNKKAAKYTALAGAGMEAINGILAIKGGLEARNLRAYYSHSRQDRPYADRIAGRKKKG